MREMSLEDVRHALTVARENGFAEVELSSGATQFSARLAPKARKGRKSAGAPTVPVEPPPFEIRSQLVGYVRESKRGWAIGRPVEVGDVVASIEALGLLNDLESPIPGEIIEVLVEPGQAVQFGQVLLRVKPR